MGLRAELHHEYDDDDEHGSSLAEQGVGNCRRGQTSIGLTGGDRQIQRNACQPCTAQQRASPPGTATAAVLSTALVSSSARHKFRVAWTRMQAALQRTDGCSEGERDAEPQESAQQVTANRGGGACGNGALPVCLSDEETWSGHCKYLCKHGQSSGKGVWTC